MKPEAHQGARIVVFTGDLSYPVIKNVVELDARIRGLTWLIMLEQKRLPFGRRLLNQRRHIQRDGWRWFASQLQSFFSKLLPTSAGTADQPRPGSEFSRDALEQKSNVRILCSGDLHSDASLAAIREFEPDLGLSLAGPILKRGIFDLPRLGTINLHKGKLPEYRGMPPAFWELWSGAESVGCSVHLVNERLDEGPLLLQTEVKRARYSDVRGLQVELDEVGIELVVQASERLLRDGVVPHIPVIGKGQTWRKPSLPQRAELQRRLEAEIGAVPGGLGLRERFKDLVFASALVWHWVLGWRIKTPRLTVLLYHRVTDEARDNLSVGVAQFERQMLLLRRFCHVVPLRQALEMEVVPRTRRPLVAVTFDDGYLDNFTYAAPILRRAQVPCSFYVTTGILESDAAFPHDVLRGNSGLKVLNWAQVRTMSQWGFEIGSHSVSHLDCVAAPKQQLEAELAESALRIRRETGADSLVFAYPYGGAHQMNSERLGLVRSAGYAGCLAAYGGSNIGHVDRWHVKRRGIHWEYSDYAFLFRCLGHGDS